MKCGRVLFGQSTEGFGGQAAGPPEQVKYLSGEGVEEIQQLSLERDKLEKQGNCFHVRHASMLSGKGLHGYKYQVECLLVELIYIL